MERPVKPAQKNLLVRIATAVVGLPVVGLIVLWREPWGIVGLCLAAVVLSLVEYAGLALRGRPVAERAGTVVLGGALFVALALRPDLAAAVVPMAVMATAFLLLPGAVDLKAAWARVAAVGFGLCYIGGLLSALPILHREAGPAWVALAIALSFGNDTGAYFAGRALGKRKLAPLISPGKTVEGALGGLVANLLVALAARALFMPELTLGDCAALAVPAAIVGPIGDLLESLLKRAAGAKDSGRLLPGHGGILDRIDALLFVGAYVCLYATHLR
jgi:phosphatidate cytidylyltransferase